MRTRKRTRTRRKNREMKEESGRVDYEGTKQTEQFVSFIGKIKIGLAKIFQLQYTNMCNRSLSTIRKL